MSRTLNISDLVKTFTWESVTWNGVWIGAVDMYVEGQYVWIHDNSSIAPEVQFWAPSTINYIIT